MTAPAQADRAPAAEAFLSIEDLELDIQANPVLRGISLTVSRGEITALVGPNGAGKSSVIKCLSGYHRGARATSFTVNEQRIALPCDPRLVHHAGLRVVHQDLGLVDDFSTLDNVILGQNDLRSVTRVRRSAWGREVQKAVESFSGTFDVHVPVRDLRPYERVIAAVARAAYGPPGVPPMSVLILDEVTAALPGDEIAVLLAHVRDIARSGVAVVFVTHHFEEVFSTADSVVVLRDGTVVVQRPTAGLAMPELTDLVFGAGGHSAGDMTEPTHTRPVAKISSREDDGPQRVVARGVNGNLVEDLNLTLLAGRILGITGRVGSGKSEVGRLMAGQQRSRSGTITYHGREVPDQQGSAHSTEIGYVPQDRDRQGVVHEMTLSENLHLGQARIGTSEKKLSRLWQERRVTKADELLLREHLVVPPRPRALIKMLSGGNQQKVVFLRALASDPPVLIVDEPTIGVDIVARAHLHGMLRDRAAAGAAVLLISSEAEEVLEVADEIAIVSDGRLGAWLDPADLTLTRLESLIAAGNTRNEDVHD
ncbi:MAG: sugar ABC transporter ATP-binding protein [Mycobacteriales bacterium]